MGTKNRFELLGTVLADEGEESRDLGLTGRRQDRTEFGKDRQGSRSHLEETVTSTPVRGGSTLMVTANEGMDLSGDRGEAMDRREEERDGRDRPGKRTVN